MKYKTEKGALHFQITFFTVRFVVLEAVIMKIAFF
jgi:hypothetical protein